LGTFGVQLIEGSGKVALIAAALLAFTLAGCGRKSSLDPPPTAAVQPGQPGQPRPKQSSGFGLFDPSEEEQLAAPAGQKRRLPIDAILD
jgi:predicted small lipoprotein YifL